MQNIKKMMSSYGTKVKKVFCLLILFCFVCSFLFLAALGLHWDVRLSLNIVLGASLVTVHRLSSCPTACEVLVLSTKDQTHVPCIGKHILNHWITKEISGIFKSTLWLGSMKHSVLCCEAKVLHAQHPPWPASPWVP